jgi:hypothetical protein
VDTHCEYCDTYLRGREIAWVFAMPLGASPIFRSLERGNGCQRTILGQQYEGCRDWSTSIPSLTRNRPTYDLDSMGGYFRSALWLGQA